MPDISCISWRLLIIITGAIAIILLCKYPAWDSKKKDSNGRPNKPRHEKWFYVWLIGLSTLGGSWALCLPLALNQKFDGADADGNQLRLHLLYITGGILALTTLGETHRKNSLEKTKNDQDHTRQVHAERRSRYTTAIEQLSNDKASIRLGGVYSLVGLVDEWLADKQTTPSPKERRKEGQAIINSLCGYIRSPFPLAERAEQLDKPYAKYLQKDFDGDKEKFEADQQTFKQHKATLEEERQVRLSIIQEICERLQGIGTSGPWAKFDYDFSNAHFFYPIDFTDSHFDASLKFLGATFTKQASFHKAEFTKYADFLGATFAEDVLFLRAIFKGGADFSWVTFKKGAVFIGATFKSGSISTSSKPGAGFIGTTVKEYVRFSKATFYTKPIFVHILSNKTFQAWFSNKAKSRSHDFEVSPISSYKIETEKYTSPDGTITTIPKGCSVFNPSLTKISIADNNIKGISVKGVSAHGVQQIQGSLKMSPWT